MNGKDRPSPMDLKFHFKCMIIWILANTRGSAKSRAYEDSFLCSTLLPEHSPDFLISPKSSCCPSVLSPACLGRWRRAMCGARCGLPRGCQFLPAAVPGFWKVKIAFSLVKSLSWDCSLQTAVSCHRNCGNISLGFLLLYQIDLKSIQQFQSCFVRERGKRWDKQHESSALFWPEKPVKESQQKNLKTWSSC